jgi:cell cycle checkpoint protein
MDSSLHEVWQAAAGSPFFPTVNKDTQFTLAFALLLVGFFLTGVFALSMHHSSLAQFCLLTLFRPHSD